MFPLGDKQLLSRLQLLDGLLVLDHRRVVHVRAHVDIADDAAALPDAVPRGPGGVHHVGALRVHADRLGWYVSISLVLDYAVRSRF